MERCLRWKRRSRAISPLIHPHPLNPRYYPLNQWELHQHWWERLIQWLVRQQHVYINRSRLDLNDGEGFSLNTVCELHRATYGYILVTFRKIRTSLWMLPFLPLASFNKRVNLVVERFQESAKQAAAFH